MTPSTEGAPSGPILSHIISGSIPARRCKPVRPSNSSWMRRRFPRQSEVSTSPGPSRSSRLRKHVHQTRATRESHGNTWNVSGSGIPTSSQASGP